MSEDTGHRLVRAAGGHMIHLLPQGTLTALCGHTPYNNPSNTMRKRAKWYLAGPHAPAATCRKCLTEAQKGVA